MINLFNKQYRVLEVTDANNHTVFHPEEKKHFFRRKWKRIVRGKEFQSYATANAWLCKHVYEDNRNIIVKTSTHKCDPVFDKLQKDTSQKQDSVTGEDAYNG